MVFIPRRGIVDGSVSRQVLRDNSGMTTIAILRKNEPNIQPYHTSSESELVCERHGAWLRVQQRTRQSLLSLACLLKYISIDNLCTLTLQMSERY